MIKDPLFDTIFSQKNQHYFHFLLISL